MDDEEKRRHENTVSRAVYAAVVKIFEGLEHDGEITGNGHHMAQKCSTYATDLLMERWR